MISFEVMLHEVRSLLLFCLWPHKLKPRAGPQEKSVKSVSREVTSELSAWTLPALATPTRLQQIPKSVSVAYVAIRHGLSGVLILLEICPLMKAAQ